MYNSIYISSDSKESACNAGYPALIPGSGDSLEKGRLSTPAFLPGKSRGQRSLAGYSSWSHKQPDTAEQLTLSLCFIYLFISIHVHVCRHSDHHVNSIGRHEKESKSPCFLTSVGCFSLILRLLTLSITISTFNMPHSPQDPSCFCSEITIKTKSGAQHRNFSIFYKGWRYSMSMKPPEVQSRKYIFFFLKIIL